MDGKKINVYCDTDFCFFFFQAEDGIRDGRVTGVQTCALPIYPVKTGETLAEVETDKAVMDLVARADGVLRQVAAAEGQTVAVGSVVAVIVSPGEAVGAVPAAAAPATPSGSGKRETGNVATVTAPAPVAVTPLPVAAAAEATRVKASPLARRMAKEAGVDLKLVTGSGPGGRVVKKDLERAPSPGPSAAPTATAAATFPVSRVPFPERTGAAYDDVPLTQIRKTIAKRLAASLGPKIGRASCRERV